MLSNGQQLWWVRNVSTPECYIYNMYHMYMYMYMSITYTNIL
jgi:hypothetical protein